MSAKPATIYLGTRSHIRRRHKGHEAGRYRNLLKARTQHHSQVKKVKKSNLAKNLSGSSTSSNKMTTSVLHLPTPDLGQQNTSPSPNATTANVKPGLPSPSSTSETSDYQRSTPSPNEDQIGTSSEIDWSQNPNEVEDAKPRRKSTSSLVNSNKISNNHVLQQLRVALKKLPEGKLTSLKPIEAVKRRYSDCGLIPSMAESNSTEKKAKISAPRRPLSASIHKGQGKITEYLPEMKHFIALRKEKLDRVLNLSSKTAELTEAGQVAIDISKKESILQNNSESGIETGSNDTASVASSGSRHSVSSGIDKDADVFEVPRTIRFPPAPPTKMYSEVVICKWELCGNEFESTGKLLDHLKSIHAVAENQKDETDSDSNGSIQYKCLWEGCKVYGKGSSSKLWLEKHVLSHGGNKPFQCIVDGCKHRFGTQTLLERHVNNHFKNKESLSGAVSTMSPSEEKGDRNLISASRSSASNQSTGTCSKVFRKLTGKRIKYRKTPFSARIFDLFDVGSMAQVRMRLSESEKKCQEMKSNGFLEETTHLSEQVVILHSRIIARKTDLDGNQKVLQSWAPPNLVEDQWILAKDFVPSKSVKLSSLPLGARLKLTSTLYNGQPQKRRGRKLKPLPRSTALS